MWKILNILIVVVCVSGCSGMAKYDENDSYAMNMAVAAGFTTQRGPLEDSVYEFDGSATDSIDIAGKFYLGQEASAFAGLTAQGMQNIFTLGAVLELLSNKTIPAAGSHWFGWAPVSEISDDDPYEAIEEIWINAYRKSIPEGYELHRVDIWQTAKLFGDYTSEKYLMTGGTCFDFKKHALFRDGAYELDMDNRDVCRVGKQKTYLDDVDDAEAPEWLGGYESYAFGMSNRREAETRINVIYAYYQQRNEETLNAVTHDEYIQKLSVNLPEWMFYYSAPFEGSPPFILNQGKRYYFVKQEKPAEVSSR